MKDCDYCVLKCSLTDVIIKRFIVKFLMDPILLNLENLLAAGILFPKRSSQNHFQSISFISEEDRECVRVLHDEHLKLCVLKGKDVSLSYFSSKQCAADRTQQESMRTPPHRWKCCLRRGW